MSTTSRASAPGAGAADDDQLPLMRRVAAAMCLLGGATCAIGIETAQTPTVRAAQIAVTVAAGVIGVALLVSRPRRALCQSAVALGILMIATLVGAADPIGTGPMFFLWPVAYAAYFFGGRQLAVVCAGAAFALALALALNPHDDIKLAIYVETCSSIGVMATLLVHMNRRERRLRDELAHAASIDPLTGLLNRRAFNPALCELIDDARTRGEPLSVVMFDLDEFKQFNDAHGHLVGDEALRVMAEVLTRHTRDSDLVARFGGEEFAVALASTDLRSACGYTDRVGVALAAEVVQPGVHLSTSAGVAELAPGAGPTTLDTLLSHADAALYAAKAGGRGRAAWRTVGGPTRIGGPFTRPEAAGTPGGAVAPQAQPGR